MDKGVHRREANLVRKGTLVYGVGTNDVDYQVATTGAIGSKREVIWRCPYYQRWVNMLERVYGSDRPAYVGVSVCKDWLVFSNFRSWMEMQDWQGKELDKDVLGSSVYGPDACPFVHKMVNMLSIVGSARQDKNSGSWYGLVRTPKGRTKTKRYRTEREACIAMYGLKSETVDSLDNLVCPEWQKPLVKDSLYRRLVKENL